MYRSPLRYNERGPNSTVLKLYNKNNNILFTKKNMLDM